MGEWNKTPEFKKIICSDGIERTILNTDEEIFNWIKKTNEDTNKKNNAVLNTYLTEYFINLSDCIIGNPETKTTLSFLSMDKGNNWGIFEPLYDRYEIKVIWVCKNSIIYNLEFFGITFLQDVTFQNTTFVGSANFSSAIFKGSCRFEKIDFQGESKPINPVPIPLSVDDVHEAQVNKPLSAAIYFENTEFKKSFTFENIATDKHISFIKARFEGRTNFINNRSDGTMFFNGSYIKSYFNISGKKLLSEKGTGLFLLKEVDFFQSIIEGKIFISCHYINNLLFINSSFEKYSGLYTMECCVDNLIFSGFHNWGHIKLDKTKIKKSISLIDAHDSGLININDSNLKSIQDRHTACVLKDESIRRNNQIDAIKYRSIEMNLYLQDKKEELKHWLKRKKKQVIIFIFSFLFAGVLSCMWYPCSILILLLICSLFYNKTVQEFTLLGLNTLSNNNGLSWTRGIIFTISVSFIFYTIFAFINREIYLTINVNEIIKYTPIFWKNVMRYLLIFNFDQIENYKDITAWAMFLFLIGKIFIGYGIYQTISAFRKHGK